MKNFLFILAIIISSGSLHSQAVNDELVIQELTRNFMSAYNNQDHKTLREMYSDDAVRIDQENNKMTGVDEIINFFKQGFINNNTTLILKHSNLTWSDAEHAFIARGTYEVTGKTHVYDIEINTKGTYANTLIKDKDKWKIAESVLSPSVTIIITQEVKDFAKFKSNFKEGLSMRMSAGELNEEVSTLHEQPNMVCVISEWTSVENFKAFYSNPDLKNKMKEAGVIGEPNVLILGKQK